MRFIRRLIILALVGWALYLGYKNIFEPFMHTFKSGMEIFCGPAWRPETE